MKTFLITGNLLFIRVDTSFTLIKGEAKYMPVSMSGGIMPSQGTYTYSEILKAYPYIKSGDSLLDLKLVWNAKEIYNN
jgi:hypothetical protein